MKIKTIQVLLFSVLAITIISTMSSNLIAQSLKHKLYTGFASIPMEVSGYKNAVLNDNHNYPNATGATFVRFEEGNTTGAATGIMIGYQYMLAYNHGPMLELRRVHNEYNAGTVFALGYRYSFMIENKFDFSVSAKYGFASVKINVTKVKNVGVMPIITNSGTFHVGDTISAEASGSTIDLLLEASYDLSSFMPNLGVFANLGFQISFFDKPKTTIAGIEVTDRKAFDEGYIKNHTIYYTADSNIDPFKNTKLDLGGLSFALGLSYRF